MYGDEKGCRYGLIDAYAPAVIIEVTISFRSCGSWLHIFGSNSTHAGCGIRLDALQLDHITMVASLQSFLVAALAVALGGHYSGYWSLPTRQWTTPTAAESARLECHPFLTPLFVESPPDAYDPLIQDASRKLDKFLRRRFSQGDIDSLSFAVVTSSGPIFEKNYGVMRGNETGSAKTTSHSMYRIASVSKLFTALEGFILEQKGALAW